jgi:hypothetical protein
VLLTNSNHDCHLLLSTFDPLNHYDSLVEAIPAYEPFVILGWKYIESYGGIYRVKYLKTNGDMGFCEMSFLEDLEEVTE